MGKFIKPLLIAGILILSGLAGLFVSLKNHSAIEKQTGAEIQADATPKKMMDAPISPTFHSPASFVKQIEGDKEAGKKIFKEFCSLCHAREPSIQVNAPLIGNKTAWQLRAKLGMPLLLKMTINGVGVMPARGGCFECSDAQLQETIVYILKESGVRF